MHWLLFYWIYFYKILRICYSIKTEFDFCICVQGGVGPTGETEISCLLFYYLFSSSKLLWIHYKILCSLLSPPFFPSGFPYLATWKRELSSLLWRFAAQINWFFFFAGEYCPTISRIILFFRKKLICLSRLLIFARAVVWIWWR